MATFELPHDLDAERFVIGCLLEKPELISECTLNADDFYGEYDDRNKLIMKYLLYLNENNIPIDPLSIAKQAGNRVERIGGISYLMNLKEAVPTTANFSYYHNIVKNLSDTRNVMLVLKEKTEAGFAVDNANEYIADTVQSLEGLMTKSQGDSEIVKLGSVLKDYEEVIEKRRESKGVTGVKTAGKDLDALTGGHQKQDLIIVAARPSIGKTAFLINDAISGQDHAQENKIEGSAAVIFSLEMPSKKIAERAVCSLGGLDGRKVKSGQMDEKDWEKWHMGLWKLNSLNIFIDDTPGLALHHIERKIKKLKEKFPNLIVYIDFLQLINPGKKFAKNDDGIKFVSQGLKQIARNHDIPVVAISAVGRQCEQRQDKRPMMSDLRESGSIESDADVIIFLYRDDYYDPSSEKKNIIELIVAKGRDVGTGVVEMIYIRSTSRFINLDRSQQDKAS